MKKEQIRQQLMHGDVTMASAAAEVMWKNVQPTDLPLLVEAFDIHKDAVFRAEVIDLIGFIPSQDACAFLRRIAQGRQDQLVRYYALRTLVELKCEDWLPPSLSPKTLQTGFYQSLLLYERHVRGEIDLESVRHLAAMRIKRLRKGGGNWWEWLLNLDDQSSIESE